jgi:hypothetical protein
VLTHTAPVQQVFPEMGGVASHLQQATAKLRDTEAREDLKTQANMYNNTLTAQFALRTCVILTSDKAGVDQRHISCRWLLCWAAPLHVYR